MKYKGLKEITPEYDNKKGTSYLKCPYCDSWEITSDWVSRNKLNFSYYTGKVIKHL